MLMNWYVVAISMLIVVVEGFVSWQEGTFTRRQLVEEWEADKRGLKKYPFNRHGGMWSDLAVLPWIFGAAAQYSSQWSMSKVGALYLLSGVITVVLHDLWSGDDTIGGHCLAKRQYTLAGLIHAMYMQVALTIVLLFFSAQEVSLTRRR